MSTFDPTQHPRGNQTTGHAGQFAAKTQTSSEVGIGQSAVQTAHERFEEARAARGRAAIEQVGDELFRDIGDHVQGIIYRDTEEGEAEAVAFVWKSSGTQQDIWEYDRPNGVRNIVNDRLGHDEDFDNFAIHSDASGYAHEHLETAPQWDTEDYTAHVLPVQANPQAARNLRVAERDVEASAQVYVDALAVEAASKMLDTNPGIRSIQVKTDEDDELRVSGFETAVAERRFDDDDAAQRFLDELGFDPTDDQQDLRWAVDAKLNHGGWEISTPKGSIILEQWG